MSSVFYDNCPVTHTVLYSIIKSMTIISSHKNSRMGASMPIPGTAWVPPTAQLTPAGTQSVNGGIPQAIAAYPTMQQFQVSPQVNSFHQR